MASSVPANVDLAAIVTVGGAIYISYHCWAFDRFKCLIPSKKDWFRVLLTWMLVASDLCLCVFALGFCVLKHKYGYIDIPGVGIMAVPADMYTSKDILATKIFDTSVTIALWLQVSLNAEEGLYWYHLMTAVRRPSSSRSWLNSSFFAAWIVITVVILAVGQMVIWINVKNEVNRTAKIYAVLGAIELTVALAASIVIVQFPKFLEDVRRSGAGREVRSRLYFYHEANKLRTFFRLLFAVSALTLGADGLTSQHHVNKTRWVAEALEQLAYTAYFLAMIVSVALYLPRTYSSALADGKVMIGNQVNRGGDDAVSNALMSLLREGAPWDEGDEKRAKGSNLDLKGNESDEWNKEPDRNDVLANFISPIAVTPATNEMPTEIRIHIQQEVMQHADGDSMHVDPPSDLTVPKKWA